jgi:hypothetical protein
MVGDADYGAWRCIGRRDNVGTVDPDVAGFKAGGAAGGEFDCGDMGLYLRRGHEDMVMPGGAAVALRKCGNNCNGQRALTPVKNRYGRKLRVGNPAVSNGVRAKGSTVSTVWSKLVSSRAKRMFLWCFAVFFTAAIALRVEAAIFASRIVSVVTALSTLRVGETSKAETLRRIPTLQPSNTGPYGAPRCNADECFYGFIINGLPRRLLWETGNEAISDVLRWWGFRAESLDIYVNFTSGKVSYFAYHLMVSAPGVPASMPPPPLDGKLGVVVIGLSSQRMISVRHPSSTPETHPPYQITPSRAGPSQSIGIGLTPDAPREIVRAGFDLRLHCVWSFGGCHRWNQLLPSVEPLASDWR